HFLLEARRTQHMRVAELHQAGAFGVLGYAALEGNRAHFVGLALGWAHPGSFSGIRRRLVAFTGGPRKGKRPARSPCCVQFRPDCMLRFATPYRPCSEAKRNRPSRHWISARATYFARSSIPICATASRSDHATSRACCRSACRPPPSAT